MANGCSDKANGNVNKGKGGSNKVSAGRCFNFLHCIISHRLFIDVPSLGGNKEEVAGDVKWVQKQVKRVC